MNSIDWLPKKKKNCIKNKKLNTLIYNYNQNSTKQFKNQKKNKKLLINRKKNFKLFKMMSMKLNQK